MPTIRKAGIPSYATPIADIEIVSKKDTIGGWVEIKANDENLPHVIKEMQVEQIYSQITNGVNYKAIVKNNANSMDKYIMHVHECPITGEATVTKFELIK